MGAYNGSAWIRATCAESRFRSGAQAVELATKACTLTNWTNPERPPDTLAAAYAESGDFDSAMDYETKAIEANLSDSAALKSAKERLALYERGKRFHRDE